MSELKVGDRVRAINKETCVVGGDWCGEVAVRPDSPRRIKLIKGDSLMLVGDCSLYFYLSDFILWEDINTTTYPIY
jgi:hypothetical protein